MFDPDTCKVRWSFGLLTFVLLLADVRAQTPCSMTSTITVTLDEGNITANQVLDSTSPYQASLPVTGTLGGPNGITLIMTSGNPLAPNPNNTFRIENFGTGTRIRLITSVDRDGPDFTNLDDTEIISFQLKCTSNADTTTTAYATVNVNIQDVNDNSPQFINTPYLLSVEELTPVGTTIYRQISALDKDSGLGARIDYTLAGDGSVMDGSQKFIFNSTRFPNLIINQSLDFETMNTLGQTTYVMSVIAKDLGTPPLSSVAQVNVTITDSDDMAPAFVYDNCLLSGIYCVDPRYSTSVVSGQITNPLIIYPLEGFTKQTASTIRAVDRDTLRSPLTFRIAGTSPLGYETYFSVAGSGPVSSGDKDVYTATLTQLQLITRSSTLTRVEVYILATQANLKYEERATVSVEIDVPNNSPPTVTTATGVNTGYIYENSRLGQNVLDGNTSSAKPLQLIVTDPDDSIAGQKTTFSFSATGIGLFNVDSNGYIYMASGNLDYETTKSATINVRVTETNTAEKRFTDVSVTILVLDLNDNDPVFTSTGAVHVSVPEGDYTLSSRLLAQVDATDADSGTNGLLAYSIISIEPAVPSGFFTINANTGEVSLSGRVTYSSDYVVVVKASDSAVPPDTIRSATKNLYVNVTSTGSNAPQIPSTLYTVTISEGTVSGTSILTVPARDPDGQMLSYTITAGNAAGKFSTDSSGQIRTVGSLDREATSTYALTVTVRDTTTPLPLSATTTVSVTLTDVNDNNPVFPNQYQFTVPENQPAGASVGAVTATDADQPSTVNSELTYRLNLANNFFAINPSTGQITTLQALDYESQSQYIFEVFAVDRANDSRTGTVSVTVFVTDVQDSVPLFTQQIFTANVAEGNAHAFVVSVSAVDVDAVDNIQYMFLSPATATTFNINGASGQINTTVALDYETQRYYEFFVTTVDGQGSTNSSSTATVRVTVLDENDNSPVLSLPVTSVQVFEDVEVNHILVTVSATDADATNTTNSEIRFLIVSVAPSSGSSFFSINRDYGQLVIERSLTNDPGVNQYQTIVRASDRGTPVLSSQATFTVNVTRNNAPLFNLSSVTVSINHTIATTTTVTSIQAVDTDPGDYGRLNYLLLGDSIASLYFQLVPAGNGVNIITVDQMTKDTSRTYYLTISAKDNAGIVSKTATATVTVNVNHNLQDPRWLNLPATLQTTISITENDPLGQAVFTLSAEDLDILSPDNQVEFRLTGNTQGQIYFRIDSIGYKGVISLIRSPVQDRTINQFTLTVNLTDKGVPPRSAGTATVFVIVLRNDQPPVYFNSTYYVQLREDVAISTNVVQVSATDSDTNNNFNQITYRMIGDDTAPNFFTIVSSGSLAGQITTSGNLATDSTDTFRISVEATDNGAFPRKATALVFVKVLRNFNSPLWPLNQLFGSVAIPENQNLDSAIYTLPLATDRDSTSPNNITNYRLIGSTPSQGQNYYQVNAATGEVTIRKDLTRDPGVTPYRLTFQAYDLGTPSLTGTQTFTLTVNVYRNTRPVFIPSIYSAVVDETTNVNSNILRLFATDSDTVNNPGGLFSQLTYRIASPSSALPYFSVLVDNGQIVLKIASMFINATLDKYLLIVQVTDDGGLSNYAEVTVDIRRNLNAPQFTQTSYVVNVTEDRAVGSGIGVTVLATDSDLRSPYKDVTYFETGQPVSLPYFDVNPSSGEVTVARPLADGTASQYIYTISARDGGNLQPTNFVTVTINVFRNQNPPVIINLPDRRPVAKTTNLGVVIFTVRATDADTVVPFNALSYSLVAGDMSAFNIHGNGDISVATNLTAYGKAELQVVAQICDGGVNRRCDSEILTVVVDSNLNEPVFVRPGAQDGFRATVTVRENIDSKYTVYDVDAMDADTSSPFSDLTYTLTGLGTGPTYFGISPTDGRITIRLSLLQDTAIQYNLTVIVRDGGSPPRQAVQTSTIVVNVIRNNNAPQWQNLPQTQIITQSYGINNIVYTANAIDSDQVFNVVTYSITGVGTAPSFFTINPNTGIVTLTGDIRTVNDTAFYLLIRASDNGTPPKSTDSVLTILVQRNEFSPNFMPNSEVFSLRIPEMQTIGVAISRVNATDQDNLAPYNTVEYYVIGDTLASIYFNVNSTSGEIFVKFPLQSDPANTQTYTLIIQARDGGSPSRISVDTARVTIEVYRNLNAPRFTLVDYITSIPETAPVGTSIFLLAFFDSDTDAPFNMMTLTAIGDGLGSSLFHVDNTGRVTTNRNLTLEVANTYQLRVRVQDGGSPSKSGTTVLTIQIQRNLLAPVFISVLYNTTILEIRDTGDIILTVTATDADTKPPNNIVRYSISSSTSSDIGRQYFMIDEATGGVSLRKSAMSGTNRATLYTFQVIATDRGEQQQRTSSIPADVRITVLRNDFTPSFTNLNLETTINETQPINTVVFDLDASDQDSSKPFGPFATLEYTIIGDDSSSLYFSIDSAGVIHLVQSLLNQATTVYKVRVRVRDGGTPPKETTTVVTVNVRRNFFSPSFLLPTYITTIQEVLPVGSFVLNVPATDADRQAPYNTVMYAFVMDDALFDIDRNTGRITVQSSLLGRTQNLYQYQIYAYDGGNPSQKSNNIPVTINIIRNQFPPEILNLPHQINITNSYLENTLVFTVQYRDNDTQAPFNTISTEIVGVVPTSDLFKINPLVANQASILMNRDANTGTKENYYIWVRARDGGSPSKTTEALLKVIVTRNCQPPTFPPVDPDNNKSVSCVTETDWNLTTECPEDRYPIVDIMITNAGNIYNGSSVNITCMIRVVKNVTPTITWKYDGTVMKPVTGSRISISDITVNPETPQRISQTMSFNRIQSSDSGTYECVVMDDNLPPSVKNMTVIVLSQPEVFIKPVTQTVDVGSTVNITCEVKDDVQITQMFWYRNGTNINSTNKLSEETFLNGTTTNIHVLTHRNIKYTTRYECRGENDAGQGNMQQAIIYVVLPGSQPGETCKTENDTRGTEWSRTPQDTYDKKPCPTEMSGEAVRYCSHGGVWRDPTYDNCIRNTLLDLQKLIDKIKNGQAPNIVPDSLVNLTGLTNPNTVELHKAEVQVVSRILNDVIQISNNTNITNNDVENFLEIASNLIDVKNSPAWQALIIEGKEGATTVLQNVEEYNRIKAKSINSAHEPVKRFTRKNLFVEIGYNPVSDIQFPNTTANGSAFINGSSSGFVLSRNVLNNGNYTSYSCAYFNNVSGIIQRYVLQNGSKTNTGVDLEINSAVLSLQLDPAPPPLLSPPLILTFKHFSANYSKPVCSYWMFIAPGSGNGAWSSNGCKVVSTSDYTTVCQCNHLTNFAILMSPGKTPDKDQVPLSIISIIGCAISIFCLSVTMIAHFIVWRYVKSDRTSLLMNLCLALIISYIIFLAGVDRTENKGVCIAVAALLHYFYLAVFFLMLTYGIELAVCVIHVFVTRSRIQWLLPLAWILPAVVVAISLGVTKLEGYGNEKFCWLSIKDGLIWAFVGPAALVTLINFIIIIVVFKYMFSSSTMMTKSDKDKAKTTVRSLCVLLPITGITWVFGILSVNEDLIVFQYLFAIINSLQGLFISLFHCFFNHNLRQAIQQINAKRKRSLVTYSTTPKISSNSSGQIKDREERHEMITEVPVNQDQMITSLNQTEDVPQPEQTRQRT